MTHAIPAVYQNLRWSSKLLLELIRRNFIIEEGNIQVLNTGDAKLISRANDPNDST